VIDDLFEIELPSLDCVAERVLKLAITRKQPGAVCLDVAVLFS